MQKITLYFILVICALLLFVSGFYFGGVYTNKFQNESILKDEFHKYISDFAILSFLDANELQKAREVMLMNQDIAIITVDSIALPQEKSSFAVAKTYMHLVYKNRKSKKEVYNEYLNINDAKKKALRQQAQAILEEWNHQP